MMKMRRFLKVFTTSGCHFPGDIPKSPPEMDEVKGLIESHLGCTKSIFKEENYCVVEIEYYYPSFDTARLLTIMDENSLLLNGYEIRFIINGMFTSIRYNTPRLEDVKKAGQEDNDDVIIGAITKRLRFSEPNEN